MAKHDTFAEAVDYVGQNKPAPTPTTNVANAVECEYMVYATFREHFENMDVRRTYSGTHIYVPVRTGQVVKITVDVLDEREMKKYQEGEAP